MTATLRSSPHLAAVARTDQIMRQVLYALCPGTALMVFFWGWGVLFNVLLAVVLALCFEALILRLRRKPLGIALGDGSAVVSAWLLALCLPPLVSWWVIAVAMLFAIVFAKQLYGGLGHNLFNPAMVGYVVVLLSFPREVTLWPVPLPLGASPLDFIDTLRLKLLGQWPAGLGWDSLSGATILDQLRTLRSQGQPLAAARELWQPHAYAFVGPALAFGLGGLWLVYRGIADWRIPLGMLLSLSLLAGVFWWLDPAHYASPLLHLFSGAVLLGAFFIATDPVTASTTPLGRILFGIGIGIFVFIIRTWGSYPDALAFAVLLMNSAVPLLDHYTRPKVFGQP